jgi:uncharacterized protein YdiU (UPF0061 family)
MITREQALELKHGDVLEHVSLKNSDGTPQRWRVNGATRTWKTRPADFRVPIKRGLREYGILSPDTAHLFSVRWRV